jgi:methionyl-tRNA formyltransferase
MARIVFMGTPEFSVPSLAALVRDGYEVAAVVTQPDRPAGRGRRLELSPVKAFAVEHDLPILQPPTFKAPEAIATLAELQPEVIVVAAFGQILRPAVLDLPPYGCINVHASLLPRWRGAAPVQAAILAGDQVTGSTIMCMDPGMDTGPILAQAALAIQPTDTGGTLAERLAQQGAALLVETLPRWLAGEIMPQAQDNSLATLCRPLRKEQGAIDWTRPAGEISLAVRAFNPWPAAFTAWQGQQLKILQAAALPGQTGGEPGLVVQTAGAIAVAAGDGSLLLEQVQLAGRAAMSAVEFARGQRSFVGSRLN